MEAKELIPFNKPFLTGRETEYIKEAVVSGKISGDGIFTKRCHEFFQNKYGFKKCLLTTSCTDALEMAAILIDIQPGDEVIMPSYTFVSTANAFVLRGAKIVFVDSREDHPGMNEDKIEALISLKTKAIVPVHYAGVACDMHKVMALAVKYNLFVIEDAAQAIDSFYKFPDGSVKPLGGIGHLSAFSFHETKNIIAGEGGMLVINDERFIERSEIIREKGTNRSAFFRGEVDKYGWVDVGSSFLPSEVIAAFLYAQLENLDAIQSKRKEIWNFYWDNLITKSRKNFRVPYIPSYATNNAHMFYIIFESITERENIIKLFKQQNIFPVFHYLSLHNSPFHIKHNPKKHLEQTDRYSDCLLRLPFYYDLSVSDQERVISIL
jgi:dTDP-4-amino-4,6-dideoxygalactose transaminase